MIRLRLLESLCEYVIEPADFINHGVVCMHINAMSSCNALYYEMLSGVHQMDVLRTELSMALFCNPVCSELSQSAVYTRYPEAWKVLNSSIISPYLFILKSVHNSFSYENIKWVDIICAS